MAARWNRETDEHSRHNNAEQWTDQRSEWCQPAERSLRTFTTILCAQALSQELADSTWTSHRAYVGLDPAPRWLHVQEGLARARITDARAFDGFVLDPERASFDSDYERQVTSEEAPAKVLPRVVDPVNLVAATAWELGVPVARLRSSRRTDVELLRAKQWCTAPNRTVRKSHVPSA